MTAKLEVVHAQATATPTSSSEDRHVQRVLQSNRQLEVGEEDTVLAVEEAMAIIRSGDREIHRSDRLLLTAAWHVWRCRTSEGHGNQETSFQDHQDSVRLDLVMANATLSSSKRDDLVYLHNNARSLP